MFRDLSPQAIQTGLLAAFTGYASSFAIVLSGLTHMGATPDEAARGLLFATLAMGLCSIWFPLSTRSPAAVAWSTPGAAFLASTAALPGGFAEAVGAILCCAALIVLTGTIPALGRLVSAIPRPVANALLAGVLLKLCFAPALALGSVPLLVGPVMAAWAVGLAVHRLAAMPMAVATTVVILILTFDLPAGETATLGLPSLAPLVPDFSLRGLISVALPLYLVTMAGQNIPGFAVLELNGYPVARQTLLRRTGFVSLLAAPFGAVPVNMSAITAAMMAGEDAGPDPARRYWAAIVSGLSYVALAFLAGPIAALADRAPPGVIVSVAGLALIPALVAALSAAFADPVQREAPALTFLIAASGMTLLGIGGAVWGILAGGLVWGLRALRER